MKIQGKTIKEHFHWEEPPAIALRKPDEDLVEIVQTLKEHPKQWAVVNETEVKLQSFPAALSGKEFERKYRSFKKDDGKKVYKNYIRYVGEPSNN